MCLLLALSYAKINDVVRDKYGLKYILLAKLANVFTRLFILTVSQMATFQVAASQIAPSWMAASQMAAFWIVAA